MIESKAKARKASEETPILFGGIETLLTGSDLVARAKDGATWLIFGSAEQSIAGAPAQMLGPDDWRADGGSLFFAGDFTMVATFAARGEPLAMAALAESADGPVLALCGIAGGLSLHPGHSFRFGPGAFVFK